MVQQCDGQTEPHSSYYDDGSPPIHLNSTTARFSPDPVPKLSGFALARPLFCVPLLNDRRSVPSRKDVFCRVDANARSGSLPRSHRCSFDVRPSETWAFPNGDT
jgi:hypothetical protein